MDWPKRDIDHVMVTAEQMVKLESQILSSGLPVEALMEKVGQAMASWFIQHSRLLEHGVVVLIGPGHNGGDGLVVARELHLAGFKVMIWCPLSINKNLTKKHLSHANWLGIQRLQSPPDSKDQALWIDALFGLAQSRPLPEAIAYLLKERQQKSPDRLVSLDVPSGICSDSGIPFSGGAAFAAFTLTVGLVKQGLVQDAAMEHVGCLERIDIGVPQEIVNELSNSLPLKVSWADFKTVRWPQIAVNASKYQRGRTFVVAGSNEYLGAAWLALQGAIASGVGSVKAVLPRLVADSLWAMAPEVVLADILEDPPNDLALANCLGSEELTRVDSLLIGPGLGISDGKCMFLPEILKDFQGLLVLDADALNRLANSKEGWEWIKKRNSPTWITPHIFEFRRLFPSIQKMSLLEAAIEASQISGACVLLKGAHSVIADPNGKIWQFIDTAPWVARSGLGDLLAGFVAGVGAIAMASRKGDLSEFLAISAFVHAQAARHCKKGGSPSDIAESLKALANSIQSKDQHVDPFL